MHLRAAEEQQDELRRQAGHDDRVGTAAQDVAVAPVSLRRIVTGTPAERTSPRPGDLDRRPEAGLVALVELAGLPARLRAAQVLVVDEVLQRVGQPLDRRQGVRREPRVAQLLDQHAEVRVATLRHVALGEPGQGGDRDPGGAQRAVLADQQVGDEVLGRPARRTGSGASSPRASARSQRAWRSRRAREGLLMPRAIGCPAPVPASRLGRCRRAGIRLSRRDGRTTRRVGAGRRRARGSPSSGSRSGASPGSSRSRRSAACSSAP